MVGVLWVGDVKPGAKRLVSQIASRFEALFGDYVCLGHMSNGEGVYAKRVA